MRLSQFGRHTQSANAHPRWDCPFDGVRWVCGRRVCAALAKNWQTACVDLVIQYSLIFGVAPHASDFSNPTTIGFLGRQGSALMHAMSRRHGLGLLMALSGVTAWGQSSHAVNLPAPQSLKEELANALGKKQILTVMVSLEGCVFCRIARQSHLLPMQKAGSAIVQIDMGSAQTVLDFQGQATTHGQLVKQWKITVAPSLLFFGPKGQEVAERMQGGYLPDFYGPYLEDRLAKGRTAL